MANWIKKNIIGLTRADSMKVKLNLVDNQGNEYIPDSHDVIKFGLKTSTDDEEQPIIEKIISPETMELTLSPQDSDLPVGDYYYDVEVTMSNGFVTTVIPPTKFKILPEVGNWRRW